MILGLLRFHKKIIFKGSPIGEKSPNLVTA
jgi:hypothetical protein